MEAVCIGCGEAYGIYMCEYLSFERLSSGNEVNKQSAIPVRNRTHCTLPGC
jgi:hypothetical protein